MKPTHIFITKPLHLKHSVDSTRIDPSFKKKMSLLNDVIQDASRFRPLLITRARGIPFLPTTIKVAPIDSNLAHRCECTPHFKWDFNSSSYTLEASRCPAPSQEKNSPSVTKFNNVEVCVFLM